MSLAHCLRADLRHYTVASVEELLGHEAMAAVRREQRLPALLRAREASARPLAILVRLFLLGDAVNPRQAELALPETAAEGRMAEILVEEPASSASSKTGGSQVPADVPEPESPSPLLRARFQIVPTPIPGHLPIPSLAGADGRSDVLIASDWGELARVQPREDHVMPVGGATRTLAALAVYAPGQRVLDVGTGCGIHAILAALSGAQVTATDVSERALTYARLNAELAGVAVDLRLGSLLEPAEGRYDIVVSNPPFVITPTAVRSERAYEYRDGGREGDALIAELVSGLPEVLASGGRAWMLGNWEIREAWMAGPASWIGPGLDAWVIQREELSPAQYVEMWLRDGGILNRDPSYEELYERWLADFEARGVEGIGMGYLCLGASDSDRPWRRFERIDGPAPESLSEYIEGVWAGRSLLDADDAVLLASTLVAHGIEHRLHAPGQSEPFMIKIAQLGGFASEIQVTSAVAAVVGACDGELSIDVLCDAVAQLLGEGASQVRGEVLPAIRELLGLGILRAA